MRRCGLLAETFSSGGGGLIQATVGIGGNLGRLFLKRFGLARNAVSRVFCRTTRMSPAKP